MDLRGTQFAFALDNAGRLTIDGKMGSFQLFKGTEENTTLGSRLLNDGTLQLREGNIMIGNVSIPVASIQAQSLQTIKKEDYIRLVLFEGETTSILYLACSSLRMQNEKTRDLHEVFPALVEENATRFPPKGKESAERRLDRKRQDTLKALVEMSEEILLDDLAAALDLSRGDLMKQIIKWKDFGLVLKGNSVTIQNKDDFIRALDQSFKEWGAQHEKT